jgi:hypothetical protein
MDAEHVWIVDPTTALGPSFAATRCRRIAVIRGTELGALSAPVWRIAR